MGKINTEFGPMVSAHALLFRPQTWERNQKELFPPRFSLLKAHAYFI